MKKPPLLCIEPDFKALAKDICDRHPNQVKAYAQGKTVLGFFIGQIMKASRGTVNPKMMSDALIVELESRV